MHADQQSCPYCGFPNKPGNLVCEACGQAVSVSSPPAAPAGEAPSSSAVEQPPEPKPAYAPKQTYEPKQAYESKPAQAPEQPAHVPAEPAHVPAEPAHVPEWLSEMSSAPPPLPEKRSNCVRYLIVAGVLLLLGCCILGALAWLGANQRGGGGAWLPLIWPALAAL